MIELLQMQNPIAETTFGRVGNTNICQMRTDGGAMGVDHMGLFRLLIATKESGKRPWSQGVETGLHLQELNLKKNDLRGALLGVLYSPFGRMSVCLYSPFGRMSVCVYSPYAAPHKGASKKKLLNGGFGCLLFSLIDDIFIIYIFNIYINYKERNQTKTNGVRGKTRGVVGGRIRRIRRIQKEAYYRGDYERTRRAALVRRLKQGTKAAY